MAEHTLKVSGRAIRIASVSEGYEFVDDPESFVAHLRQAGPKSDLFTFIPRLSERTSRHDYARTSDNLAVVPVSTFEEWFNRRIGNKTRNLVRKAERSGVTVREVPFDDTLISGIAVLNNETPVRQGRRYWHYRDDHDTVRRKNETFQERSVFIGAFFEERLIGYVKLTSDERGAQAGLMQILAMIKHRDKAPTNALIAHAVRVCASRGIQHLWYARFSYQNKTPDGLAEFKRHNGFEQVHIPRYYIPLTMRGRLALQLKLQNGVAARLPLPLLDTLRQLRNRWHDSQVQQSHKCR